MCRSIGLRLATPLDVMWAFDSVRESAVSAQILRHSHFIETSFDEYLIKNSFLMQFSDVSTVGPQLSEHLCATSMLKVFR